MSLRNRFRRTEKTLPIAAVDAVASETLPEPPVDTPLDPARRIANGSSSLGDAEKRQSMMGFSLEAVMPGLIPRDGKNPKT